MSKLNSQPILLKISALAVMLMTAGATQALTIKPYSAAELATAQSAGLPVAVHFHADWCPVCVAQARAFETLRADPSLDKVALLVANFDTEKDLKKTMSIRSQSTLVVFRSKNEVARLGGDTDPAKLKTGLSASVANQTLPATSVQKTK